MTTPTDETPNFTEVKLSLDYDEDTTPEITDEDVEDVIKSLDCVNIVCKSDAIKDITTWHRIFHLASKNKVQVAACPSLSTSLMEQITPEQLQAYFAYIIGALHGVSRVHKHPLSCIKHHGEISVKTASNLQLAKSAVSVVPLFYPIAIFVGLPGTQHQDAVQTMNKEDTTDAKGTEDANVAKNTVTFLSELTMFDLSEWYVDLKYDEHCVPIIPEKQAYVSDKLVKSRVKKLLEERLISATPELKLPDQVKEILICVYSKSPEAFKIVREVKNCVDEWKKSGKVSELN